MTKLEFRLTQDDLVFQNDVRVHLDTWLKKWEWEQILKNQEIVQRVKKARDECYKNGSTKDTDWLSALLGDKK